MKANPSIEAHPSIKTSASIAQGRGRRWRRERGLALVCALMLMLAAMVIGVAVARGAFVLLAAAHNERDRDVAQAAAEAALRDAERDIAGAAASHPGRGAHFGPAGAAAFADDCGHGADDLGLCGARSPPAWQTQDLADPDNPALVPYGRFTGATLAVGRGTLPARLPAYVIERIAPAGATAQQGSFYRITAIGFGIRASTRVVLQSLYRLPPAAPGSGGPGNGADTGAGGDTGGSGGPPGDGGRGGGAGHAGGNDGGNGEGGDRDDGHDDEHGGGHGGSGNGNDNDHGGGHGGNGNGNDNDNDNDIPPAAQSPGRRLPAGRLGWREIANWAELHAHPRP